MKLLFVQDKPTEFCHGSW